MKHDLTEFFKDLTDRLKVFKGGRDIPFANMNGCRVKLNKKGDAIDLAFISVADSEVILNIKVRDLYASPKEYIDNLFEVISQGLSEMKNNSQLIAMPGKDFSISKLGAR
jgi:hypothetical protein